MIAENDIDKLKHLLSNPQQISIVTHTNPDGDAIGSSLGLYNILIQKKHKVKVIVPNSFPEFLKWMKDSEKVLNYETSKEEADAFLQTSDILFMLDFNNLKRIDELAEIVEKIDAFKILIDHHLQPDVVANITISDTTACATCQMVFEVFDLLGQKNLINKEAADCLYCGIMTDTASFRFDTTTAKTHKIIAQLLEKGVVKSNIHGAVYDQNTLSKIQLVSYCLSNNLNLYHNGKVAVITLTTEEQKKFDMKKGDTEGLVNNGLSVLGVQVSAFFSQKDDIIKISFRSKKDVDVNTFARKYFDGGGHKNAAGAKSLLGMQATVDKFIELSKELVPNN